MEESEWGRLEITEIFPDPVHKYVSLATFTVDADTEFAKQFLLEPLPFLAENLDGVDRDWEVSLERVNAGVRLSGPRKLVVVMIVLTLVRSIRVVAYRLPEDAA
jgi:hypothetical protein